MPALSTVNFWRAKRARDPVLTADDEAFLQRITSPGEPTHLPHEAQPIDSNAQVATMGEAQALSLPSLPTDDGEEEPRLDRRGDKEESDHQTPQRPEKDERHGKESPTKMKSWPWGWLKRSNTAIKKNQRPGSTPESQVLSGKKLGEEPTDLAEVLERLNLAPVNNRAFSISDETQELLHKFKLILKDLINGIPAAYHDLESLLTNSDRQLQDAFNHLPDSLQKLVQHLSDKLSDGLTAELLATAGKKASESGLKLEDVGKATEAAQKMGWKLSNLRGLVAKPTALIALLRSIISSLGVRFPAVMSMNVLWSLALFLLLFVLWYCHKRGREVRLEKERLAMEAETAKMNDGNVMPLQPTETPNTTAPLDTSTEEVRKDTVKEAQKARDAAISEGNQQSELSPPRSPRFAKLKHTSQKTRDIELYRGT